MAIQRTSPDVWEPMIDKIAELVGREVINMYYNEEIPLTRTAFGTYEIKNGEVEAVAQEAVERVIGKMRLIMPRVVQDKIYEHRIIDQYFDELYDLIKKDHSLPSETFPRYRTDSQRLAEVGMSMRDFV